MPVSGSGRYPNRRRFRRPRVWSVTAGANTPYRNALSPIVVDYVLAAGSGTVLKSSSDTGSGTDAQSIVVTLTGADTGAGTDGQSIVVTLTGNDTGSGADNVLSIVVPISGGADTGTGTDGQSISVTWSLAEQASGADAFTGARTSSQAETGTGTDAQSPSAVLSQAETGAGSDTTTGSARAGTQADTGAAVETEVVVISGGTIFVASSDTVTFTEGQTVLCTISSDDSGFGATLSFVRYGKRLTLLGASSRTL